MFFPSSKCANDYAASCQWCLGLPTPVIWRIRYSSIRLDDINSGTITLDYL